MSQRLSYIVPESLIQYGHSAEMLVSFSLVIRYIYRVPLQFPQVIVHCKRCCSLCLNSHMQSPVTDLCSDA